MDPSVLTVYKSPFKKIRLGREYDGGYVINLIPNANYKLLIGCGISDDISFEDNFLNVYPNCLCFVFDGTINNLPTNNDKIYFIKKNIGPVNNIENTNLHHLLNTFDNIFLKIDIEGAEIPWIKSLSDEQINKFEQIVIEFHFPFTDNEIDVFDKINKNHFLVHFHGNNNGSTRYHKGIIIPDVFECTYLHKKYFVDTPELNSESIPTSIDMRNAHWREDIKIDYPPFVHS